VQIADLHIHTTASDGTWQPETLVQAAIEKGLAMIAVTDHDTTQGVAAVQAVGEKQGLTVISGVELSVDLDKAEVHLLGLGIDPLHPELQQVMAQLHESRYDRGKRIVGKLKSLGIDISFSRVQELADNNLIGRPHIARALVESGYAESIGDAFIQYLGNGRPAYVTRYKIGPSDAIRIIHAAGGVAIWAHPGLNEKDELLPELLDYGLDGLEAYHSAHHPDQIRHYLELADHYQLIVSGGSDCHGPGMREQLLLGTVPFPLQDAKRIVDAYQKIRNHSDLPESN
jgi:predicted metal-dependent phosphoesterase TrpH